ncbi:testis specific serine kinase 4 [Rhinolophus ferrumequinum]|uniref:Testis specific serine kinase 4 n=2 Tax=Rhinolophus ferrumequinum TaxID=59479 RepID=A0A7J7XSE5_RHIFE|nr:testis specific serine kinase 4 [Rhinolophus ferrumequinum]
MGRGDTQEAAPPTSAYRSVMEEYGYEVGKVIGNGSYGTVYEAYYTKQNVRVAIKIISKKKASDDYLNKFLPREIQNLVFQMLRQATKRATILDIIKDPWVLKFQFEPPTHEIRLLEAMWQPASTTNRHQSLETITKND